MDKRITEIAADGMPFFRLQSQPYVRAATAKVSGFCLNSRRRPLVALVEASPAWF